MVIEMNTIIIPARLKSSRLRNKLLIEVNGKSIIQYTLENALSSKLTSRVIVATEDMEIKRHVESLRLNIDCLRTPIFNSGTERVKHIVREASPESKKIINMQADEPCLRGSTLDDMFNAVNRDTSIASAYSFIDNELDYDNEHVVKVTLNIFDMALYFSRRSIPYGGAPTFKNCYKHIGVYAFYRDTLLDLPNNSEYQKMENLEQLAWLENGYNIKLIRINYPTVGIDVQEHVNIFKTLAPS